MNFNRNYEAIEKLWKRKFENNTSKREEEYFLSKMNKLKTSFLNKQYSEAIGVTKILFGYFSRIGNSKNNPLNSYALAIAGRLWDLESILEKKVKQPSGANVCID